MELCWFYNVGCTYVRTVQYQGILHIGRLDSTLPLNVYAHTTPLGHKYIGLGHISSGHILILQWIIVDQIYKHVSIGSFYLEEIQLINGQKLIWDPWNCTSSYLRFFTRQNLSTTRIDLVLLSVISESLNHATYMY